MSSNSASALRLWGLAGLLALTSATTPAIMAGGAPADYWGVTLSWSPEFCHDERSQYREYQCSEAHGFVLGGMTGYSAAGPLDSCPEHYETLPDEIVNRMIEVMWNKSAMTYEWRKHGSCTGLPMMQYFTNAEYVSNRVQIPDVYTRPFGTIDTTPGQILQRFLQANPQLGANSIVLRCERQWLREVVVCVDGTLNYKSCGIHPEGNCEDAVKIRGIDNKLKPPSVS